MVFLTIVHKKNQKFLDRCEFFVVIRQISTGEIYHIVGYPKKPTSKDLSALWAELKNDTDFPNTAEIVWNKDVEYKIANRTKRKDVVDWLLSEI
jgi:hypothetical protein